MSVAVCLTQDETRQHAEVHQIDYAEFCDRVAGRFIHHVPDEFVAPERRATAGVLAPTVEAIKTAGLPFHPELWASGEGSCSQCHAGCTNCGQGDGNPS